LWIVWLSYEYLQTAILDIFHFVLPALNTVLLILPALNASLLILPILDTFLPMLPPSTPLSPYCPLSTASVRLELGTDGVIAAEITLDIRLAIA
jgi:hypothetical protein